MPKVWKHFLKNLAWPVSVAGYLFGIITGAAYLETVYKGSAVAVVALFVTFPIAVYLIRDMWRDAKQKVEWENEEIKRMTKGK